MSKHPSQQNSWNITTASLYTSSNSFHPLSLSQSSPEANSAPASPSCRPPLENPTHPAAEAPPPPSVLGGSSSRLRPLSKPALSPPRSNDLGRLVVAPFGQGGAVATPRGQEKSAFLSPQTVGDSSTEFGRMFVP